MFNVVRVLIILAAYYFQCTELNNSTGSKLRQKKSHKSYMNPKGYFNFRGL